MGERIKITAKKPLSTKENSVSNKLKTGFQSLSSQVDKILFLQRTIGNQAVQRLIKSGALQAKLRIGQPGDKYEQEADRVAGQVMSMPEPPLQRQTEEEEEKEILQTKENPSQTPEVTSDIESRINSIRSGGQPLPESTRSFFEQRFGYDFRQVRAHADAKSAESARALNAKAYTIGRDVAFGMGQYVPETEQGKRLLAHELTHVVQQGRGVSLERFPYYKTRGLQRKDKIHIQPTGIAPTIQRTTYIIPVKLPSGNKTVVTCEIPNYPQTCNKNYLKPPTGQKKKVCEKALKDAMPDSGVKKIIGKLNKIKGCLVPTIDCKDCTASCKGAGAWHFSNAIHFCADTYPNKTYAIGYLKHELTHQLQYCRGDPDVTCSDRMKMEIEANKADGSNFESSFGDAVWSSCFTKRCTPSDIENKKGQALAAAMKKHYDSL